MLSRRLLIVALVLMIVLLAIPPLIGVLTWNAGGTSLTYMKGGGDDFRAGIPPGTLVFVLALTALTIIFVRRALVNTDALHVKATIRRALTSKGHIITRELVGLFIKDEVVDVDRVYRRTRSRRGHLARGPALTRANTLVAGATGG